MQKKSLAQKFQSWTLSRQALLQRVDDLKKENDQLKEKIADLQRAKVVAQNQADELRKEKERLRQKATSLKQADELHRKAASELGDRVQELLQRNKQLELQRQGPKTRAGTPKTTAQVKVQANPDLPDSPTDRFKGRK